VNQWWGGLYCLQVGSYLLMQQDEDMLAMYNVSENVVHTVQQPFKWNESLLA